MIIVKGEIPVKTDHRDEAVALVLALAEASRSEDGCLAYEVYLQAERPEVIVVWQQWYSMEALECHFASDHVDAFLDAIPDMIEGQVTSSRFEVRASDEQLLTTDDMFETPPVLYGDEVIMH